MQRSTSQPSSVCTARRDQIFELFQPILAPIVSHARVSLPRTIDPQDLAQIAALALLDAAATFETYAKTRVKGAVLDAGRWNRYKDEKALRIDEFPEFAAPPALIDEQIDRGRRKDLARAAIASLPQPQRNVIEMRNRGTGVVEIAAAAGVTPRTVIRISKSAVNSLRLAVAA